MTADSSTHRAPYLHSDLSKSESAKDTQPTVTYTSAKRQKLDSSDGASEDLSELLDHLDLDVLVRRITTLKDPPTKPAVLTALLGSSSKPSTYSFGSISKSVLNALTHDVDPSIIVISLKMRAQLEERGRAILSPPFNQMLDLIKEHLVAGKEASGRMLIDQYLLAALHSAKREIREDSQLCHDLVTRLQIQQKWPKAEVPHPVLSLESKVDIMDVAPDVSFSGFLDYLISFIRKSEIPDLPTGQVENDAISTPSRVPLVVVEAKSTDEFKNKGVQMVAQAIALCNVAGTSHFVSALTSGRDWRFYFARKIAQDGRNPGKYEVFKTNVLNTEKNPCLTVGMLVMAIVEDPATMLKQLQLQ